MPTVTALLREWRAGDPGAADRLMPLVYDELHRIAARSLRGERPGHTLRPTDLVSEAYLRIFGGTQPEWTDRIHFFAVAARSMRRVLVDHVRRHRADKRGAGQRPVALDEAVAAAVRSPDVVALDEALDALAAVDARRARAIELHYFAGLSQPEIATLLEVHVNTVQRDLRLAEAWIHRFLRTADPVVGSASASRLTDR